jgi:hypothetical protein
VFSYFWLDLGYPVVVRLLAVATVSYVTVWLSILVLVLLTNEAANRVRGGADLPSLQPAAFSLGILAVALIAIPWFLFHQFHRPAPKPTYRVQEWINDFRKWWKENKGWIRIQLLVLVFLSLFSFWLWNLWTEAFKQARGLPPEAFGRLADAAVLDVQLWLAYALQNLWIVALPFLPLIVAVVASSILTILRFLLSPVLPPAGTERHEVNAYILRAFTSVLVIFTISFFLLPRIDERLLDVVLPLFPLPFPPTEIDVLRFANGADLDLREDFNALELVLTVLTASFAVYSSNQYLKSVLENILKTFGDKKLKTTVDRMKLPVKSAVGGRQLPNDYPGLVEINASSTASILPHFPSDQSVARIRLQLGGERHHDKSPWSQLGSLLDTAGIDLGKSIVFVYSRKEEARDLVFYCTGAEFKALAGSKELDPDVCGTKFIGDCLIEALADDDTRTLRDIVQSRRKLFDKRAGESGLICSTYVKDSMPVREVLDVMGRERVDRVLVTSSSEPRELAIVGAAQLGKFLSRP